MRTRSLGMVLLGVWLVLQGVVSLIQLSFAGLHPLLGLLALASGALILVNR